MINVECTELTTDRNPSRLKEDCQGTQPLDWAERQYREVEKALENSEARPTHEDTEQLG